MDKMIRKTSSPKKPISINSNNEEETHTKRSSNSFILPSTNNNANYITKGSTSASNLNLSTYSNNMNNVILNNSRSKKHNKRSHSVTQESLFMEAQKRIDVLEMKVTEGERMRKEMSDHIMHLQEQLRKSEAEVNWLKRTNHSLLARISGNERYAYTLSINSFPIFINKYYMHYYSIYFCACKIYLKLYISNFNTLTLEKPT